MSINIDLNQFVIYHLYESVNNNKNQVVVVIFLVSRNWLTCNKIYEQVFLLVNRDWKKLQIFIKLMRTVLKAK